MDILETMYQVQLPLENTETNLNKQITYKPSSVHRIGYSLVKL